MNHHGCDVIHFPTYLKGDALEVLTAAFQDSRLMQHVFLPDEAGHVESLRAMFGFSCELRFELDWPLLGAVDLFPANWTGERVTVLRREPLPGTEFRGLRSVPWRTEADLSGLDAFIPSR